jgi:hypothetical protein
MGVRKPVGPLNLAHGDPVMLGDLGEGFSLSHSVADPRNRALAERGGLSLDKRGLDNLLIGGEKDLQLFGRDFNPIPTGDILNLRAQGWVPFKEFALRSGRRLEQGSDGNRPFHL